MFSEVVNTSNQVPAAGTVAPGRSHTEILADLQAIVDVEDPISESQRNLGQEINHIITTLEQDEAQKVKWRGLCTSILRLQDEEARRVFDIMHKIDGIDAELHSALHSALKRGISQRRLMADIGQIAYTSINFATNILGPQNSKVFLHCNQHSTSMAWFFSNSYIIYKLSFLNSCASICYRKCDIFCDR